MAVCELEGQQQDNASAHHDQAPIKSCHTYDPYPSPTTRTANNLRRLPQTTNAKSARTRREAVAACSPLPTWRSIVGLCQIHRELPYKGIALQFTWTRYRAVLGAPRCFQPPSGPECPMAAVAVLPWHCRMAESPPTTPHHTHTHTHTHIHTTHKNSAVAFRSRIGD